MSQSEPFGARLVPASGTETPSHNVLVSGMETLLTVEVKVSELSGKLWPSATCSWAFTDPPEYWMPFNVACHPSSSPGKPTMFESFESLPSKTTTSRSSSELPSSKNTISEAPFALCPVFADKPETVYPPSPDTNSVTSARKLRLDPVA